MSIEFARSYKTSDGKCHGTLREDQAHELADLVFKPAFDKHPHSAEDTAQLVVENSDLILMCLTLTDSSRPKARGSKKPRKNRVTEPVQTTSA